jgi:GT2 family glycosyltransferase
VTATVIVPFHRGLDHLARSLAAARRSLPDAEIVVAADGAVEDCRAVAASAGARVVDIEVRSGPAVARNRGAAGATGDVLVFVDADVEAAPDALMGMCQLLETERKVAAVFGAYGLKPPAPGFLSQYRNLSHACVHEMGHREAGTFWAGLGAVRAAAFRQVGGFDERFTRPSVEDIDLGYRLRAAGHRVRLDPNFRGEHLKRWTLWRSIVTDVADRGVPWTQLILRYGALADDLNTRWELRWSIVLSYVFVAALAALAATAWAALVAAAALVALVALNRPYYQWFQRRRGTWFALRVIPLHLLYHLCNGLSFIVGAAFHAGAKAGVRLPGALPRTAWSG